MNPASSFANHICHIYRSEEEKGKVQRDFFREGVRRGEKVLCVAQPQKSEERSSPGCEEVGGGGIRFHSVKDVFGDERRPDAERAVSLILRWMRGGLEDGFAGIRMAVEMGWASGNETAEMALLEFEVFLEKNLKNMPALCMCQYPLEGFSPFFLLGVLGAHPMAIFEGRIIDNRDKAFAAAEGDLWGEVLGKFLAHAQRGINPIQGFRGEEGIEVIDRGATSRMEPFGGLPDPSRAGLGGMESRAVQLADALADAVVGWDARGRIILWNRAAEGLTGLEAAEVWGRRVVEIFSFPGGSDRLPSEGAIYPGTIREGAVLTKDGSWLGVEFTLGCWEAGEERAYVAVLREEREKKLMERALRESEKRYRELFENMGEGVAVVDEEENILFANPAGHRIFGVEKGDLVGRNLKEFTDEENFALLQEQTLIRRSGRRSVYELQIVDAAGQRKVLRVTATPRFDREGNYRGAFGVFTDITERKYREEELEAFASTVAHDLSGSLTIVEGFSLAAERAAEEGDRETEMESLLNIREAVGRMQRMVDSLLQYAKAGRPEGEAKCVYLKEVAAEVGRELKPLLQSHDVELRIESPGHEAWVDPVRLRQVLYNLISNAAAHMGEVQCREVVVGSRKRRGNLVVYVRDNGVGIPAEMQDKVFEPFQRGEGGGSGLGLAIVKRAVESWGGRVWLDSAPGKGTTFFFTVPAYHPGNRPSHGRR